MAVASEALQAVVVDQNLRTASAARVGFLVEPLTAREREIVAGLEAGRTNAEIATLYSISIHTVEFHLKNVYAKLGVSSRLEAVIRAREMGL